MESQLVRSYICFYIPSSLFNNSPTLVHRPRNLLLFPKSSQKKFFNLLNVLYSFFNTLPPFFSQFLIQKKN